MEPLPTTASGTHSTFKPVLTEREVAERLGLSCATLRAWRHRRKGPRYVRFGRAVRYLPRDVDEFIRANLVDTGSVSSSNRASQRGGQ
jgi:predicted DNA-binding transcriptional regulator AlpA